MSVPSKLPCNDSSEHNRPTRRRVSAIRSLLYAAGLTLFVATLWAAPGCGGGNGENGPVGGSIGGNIGGSIGGNGGGGACAISPIVTSIAPRSAQRGAEVTINGNNFSGTNTINFLQAGIVKQQITVPNGSIETTIKFSLPAALAPGAYDVQVTDSDGCPGNTTVALTVL